MNTSNLTKLMTEIHQIRRDRNQWKIGSPGYIVFNNKLKDYIDSFLEELKKINS